MSPEGEGAVFSFAVGTDIHHLQEPIGAIFGSIGQRDPDFALFIGDNIAIEIVLYFLGRCCTPQSLFDYEIGYRALYTDPAFREFAANTPSFKIWDDHEIKNDWDQGTTPPYPWARLAWEEYVGAANPPPRATGGTHYAFNAGDVGFYVLDTRTYRSPGEEPDGSGKTMLGAEQKADLKSWLQSSTARFKIIVSSVMWNDFSRHAAYGESWPAYRTERDEILDFIRDRGIGGVALLSGDEHWTGVFRIEPWKIYEVSPGPITYGVRSTSSDDSQILFKRSWTRVFSLFTIDSVSSPATVTLQIIDEQNQVLYAVTATEEDLGRGWTGNTRVPALTPSRRLLLVAVLVASAAWIATRQRIAMS
jgi:hypothetical protein